MDGFLANMVAIAIVAVTARSEMLIQSYSCTNIPCPDNTYHAIVYVDSHGEQCENLTDMQLCGSKNYTSLKCALKCTHNCIDTTVRLSSSVILSERLYISNRSNITITGSEENGTSINCDPHNTTDGFGIILNDSSIIKLSQLTIRNCGATQHYPGTKHKRHLLFQSALLIAHCKDITLEKVYIQSSKGTGLLMLNVKGKVSINKSNFSKNMGVHGGGGVHLTMWDTEGTTIVFNHCQFIENNKVNGTNYEGLASGGGLQIRLVQNAVNVTIVLQKCYIERNCAEWGGGLFIGLLYNANHNKIYIYNSIIENNRASEFKGGGGVDMGFYDFNHAHYPKCNTVLFENTEINSNRATYGGGISVFSEHFSTYTDNSLTFVNCTWFNNKASFSAAIDVSPNSVTKLTGTFAIKPLFSDCKFIDNKLDNEQKQQENERHKVFKSSSLAIFSVSDIDISIQGQTEFINNTGTALRVYLATVTFKAKANVSFIGNSGQEGGAVALMGVSILYLEDDTTVIFINNSAELGGAINYQVFQKELISSRSCFLTVETNNTHFVFEGNKAFTNVGTSVYASTLYPCKKHCKKKNCHQTDIKELLNCCVGTFEINETNNTWLSTTSEAYYDSPREIFAKPGEVIQLSLGVFDEVRHNITNITIFKILTDQPTGLDFQIDSNFRYTTTGEVRVYGNPRSKGKIKLVTMDLKNTAKEYQVILTECPPGYEIRNQKCTCMESHFINLYCETKGIKSFIKVGTWVGKTGESILVTSGCPLGFCKYNTKKTAHSTKFSQLYQLPYNLTHLNEFICQAGRKGIICGDCQDGYSALYHSNEYKCQRDSDQCKYGILVYLVSELLPTTLVFLFVLSFNISFTSGGVNGFILFAQIVDLICINNNGLETFDSSNFLISQQKIIYGLLSLSIDTGSNTLASVYGEVHQHLMFWQ